MANVADFCLGFQLDPRLLSASLKRFFSNHNLGLVILSIGVDAKKAGRDAPPAFAVKVDHSHPEVTRFYCDTEQAYLTEATWVHFTGCLYFLPKLFTVPAFRPVLESLFPDPSLALTYLLRTLMIPNDGIWEQVKEQDNALFANVDRRVGIQVCSRHFLVHFQHSNLQSISAKNVWWFEDSHHTDSSPSSSGCLVYYIKVFSQFMDLPMAIIVAKTIAP